MRGRSPRSSPGCAGRGATAEATAPAHEPLPTGCAGRVSGPAGLGTGPRLRARALQCALGQQQQGTDQEADGADEGAQIGQGHAQELAARGDVRRHRGDAEGDGARPGSGGDPPRDPRRVARRTDPWHSSAQASQLATRKQMEPSASGRQIGWWSGERPNPTSRALRVVRLNHRVPISWMPAAHQSMRRCRIRSSERRARCGAVREVGRGGRDLHVLQEGGGGEEDRPDEEGDVVRRGPHRSGVGRERAQGEADGPDGEQDPHPPVHGERRPPGRAAGTRPACLRCQRESHRRRGAVGRRKTSRVTKGPKPRLSRRRQPLGTST